MLNRISILLAGFCFIFIQNLKAADLYVTNTNDAGAGSLRAQIAAAAAGDRVIIDIKGTINLLSPITITTTVMVHGPFPAHCNINSSSIGITNHAFIVQSGTLMLRGVAVTNTASSSDVGGIYVMAGAGLQIDDCVIEGQTSFVGAGIKSLGSVLANNVSFVNNITGNDGGGIWFNTASASGTLVNCTFSGNGSTGGHGGGVYAGNGANITIRNCTFKGNSVAGVGDDLAYGSAGTTVKLHNCIFDSNLANSISNSGGPNITSLGGNVFGINNPGFITTAANDIFSATLLSLAPLKTDGYGLKYHLITSQLSPAVDNGTTGSLPLTDCRRAPRTLYGDSGLNPDAGAVEFTPFSVINAFATGAGSFTDAVTSINITSFPPPYFIDFRISLTPTINLGVPISLSKQMIIDGYSQEGSLIGGPGTTPNTLVTLTPSVTLDGGGSTAVGLVVSNGASGSKIMGLKVQNFSQQGILLSSNNGTQVLGCMLIDNDIRGIEINAGSANMVGDSAYHFTNMISGNTSSGVMIFNSPNNMVRNNLIGTNANGTAAYGNQLSGVEIFGNTATGNMIGGQHKKDHFNIISGSTSNQVLINSAANNNYVLGNHIGTTYSGINSIAGGSNGIMVTAGAGFNFLGGGSSEDYNVICAQTNAGIFLDNSSGNVIINNYIGYSPFPSPAQISNNSGIILEGTGSVNNTIGTAAKRNYVCGNTGSGMKLNNGANGNSFTNNFIGINHLNAIMGNSGEGILIQNNSPGNSIGTANGGNFIGGNGSTGISLFGSRSNNVINNTIGMDSTRTLARANNLDGISLNSVSNNNTINGNFMSFNLDQGIEINSDSCLVLNNIIGTDISGTLSMGNGGGGIVISGNANRIGDGAVGDNTIAFNTGAGVVVSSGISNSIIKNKIYSNTQLGIDLNGNGVTANDPTDSDNGPNNLLNFPDALIAVQCGAGVNIAGSFYGNAGITYRIDFYQLNASDPSGYGEGDLWLNSILVTPSVTGTNTFTYAHAATLPLGTLISATLSEQVGAGGYYHTSEFSAVVTVEPGMSGSTATATNISCFGANDGEAIAVANGGLGPYTFDWYNSSNTSIGVFNDTASNLASDTYLCIIIDATGCADTTNTVTITEPAALTAVPTSTNPVCNGDCNGTITIAAAGGTAPIQYSIDGGSTYFTSSLFNSLCAGNYNQIQVIDANGCTQLATAISLVDPPALVVSFTTSDESCSNACDGSITMTVTSGVTPYLYSIDGGSTFFGTSTFNALCAGVYSCVVTDGGGCSATSSETISTGLIITANAGADASVCPGASYTLDGSASVNGMTYSWFDVSAGSMIGSTATTNISPTATGNYALVISNGGCSDMDTVLITLLTAENPDVQYAFIVNDTVVSCESGPAFNPTSIATPGGTFTVSGLSINPSTGNVTVSGAPYNQYNIIYTTPTCAQTDTIYLFVLPDPTPPVSTQYDYIICQGDPVPTLTTDPTGVVGAMVWYNNANLNIPVQFGYNYTPANVVSGYNDYFAAISYANCKSTGTQFSISMVDASLINDGGPYTTCPDQPVQISLSAIAGTIGSILWTPSAGLSDSTITNPIAVLNQTQTFYFTTDIGGCSITDSVTVQVNSDPSCIFDEMYNAFSPDDDGVNDTWIIPAVVQNPNNKVIIFNRWGNELVSFDNYDNVSVVWDGTYKNEKLPSGTYFYVIKYIDVDRQYSGWVQLTR
ncbi:MAG: gliding motility-associated C-terminal domain-containing protein [Flavobacteriales bacterium]|nr:gliding motility-associated C-terminal domain-containing protein [Flavobacteriales bacterium]